MKLYSLTTIPILSLILFSGNDFFTPKKEHLIMEIQAQRKDCPGIGPKKCLVVRFGGAKDWELFYGVIDDFFFEEGIRYKIIVNRKRMKNVAAYAVPYKYKLKKIISKKHEE